MEHTPQQRAISPHGILALLPAESRERLLERFSFLPLRAGEVLHSAGGAIEYVYFLQSGAVCLLVPVQDGTMPEAGIIAADGMVGAPLMAGVTKAYAHARVLVAADAFRMSARDFRFEFAANAPFRTLLLRANEARIAALTQAVACMGRHSLQQRLARWLLTMRDKLDADVVPLGVDAVATLMGVKLKPLAEVMDELQHAALVRLVHESVAIIDASGLQRACCECYSTVRQRRQYLFQC